MTPAAAPRTMSWLQPLCEPWRTRRQLELLKPGPGPRSCEFAILGDVEPCRFRLLRLVSID